MKEKKILDQKDVMISNSYAISGVLKEDTQGPYVLKRIMKLSVQLTIALYLEFPIAETSVSYKNSFVF